MNSFQITACLELGRRPRRVDEEWIGTHEYDVDITSINILYDMLWASSEVEWM
jgi:hypothetical protein